MFNLDEIQSTAETVLAAATLDGSAYYESGDVILDDGTKRDQIEERLATRGFVTVVEKTVGVRITDRAANVCEGIAAFTVSVKVNPKVNAENLNRDPIKIVDVNASAMLAHGTDPTDRFDIPDDAVDLICDDEGLVWYLCMFTAHTTLAPYVNV